MEEGGHSWESEKQKQGLGPRERLNMRAQEEWSRGKAMEQQRNPKTRRSRALRGGQRRIANKKRRGGGRGKYEGKKTSKGGTQRGAGDLRPMSEEQKRNQKRKKRWNMRKKKAASSGTLRTQTSPDQRVKKERRPLSLPYDRAGKTNTSKTAQSRGSKRNQLKGERLKKKELDLRTGDGRQFSGRGTSKRNVPYQKRGERRGSKKEEVHELKIQGAA